MLGGEGAASHDESAAILAQARRAGLERAVEHFPEAVLRAYALARRYAAALKGDAVAAAIDGAEVKECGRTNSPILD